MVCVRTKISAVKPVMSVVNARAQFSIETVNDFKTTTQHNLDLFELPVENRLLLDQNKTFLEMMHDFDYFFRKRAQIVSQEFRKENKGNRLSESVHREPDPRTQFDSNLLV